MATASKAVPSFGTLVECAADGRCLWTDRNGDCVPAEVMMEQLLAAEGLMPKYNEDARRTLEDHVMYLEDMYTLARAESMQFPYTVGVNERHLYHKGTYRKLSARDFVNQEVQANDRRQRRRRRLAALAVTNNTSTSSSSSNSASNEVIRDLPASLNWCTTDNPQNRSICTPVKSQENCGSCWAFAAADAIETAVAINSKAEPQTLSPQQFLECSTREMTAPFRYCWSTSDGVDGASWLLKEMKWGSQNNGCSGGMTHAAFQDAAQLSMGLLSMLDLPYSDDEVSEVNYNDSCVVSAYQTAATISDWEQAIGKSCAYSSDPTELLKVALQQQPIAVAINSGSTFNDYKSGIYQCPDDGDFPDSAEINHALLLVGYGSTADGVDYWILKNSYSTNWGENGFLKLEQDSKINCGVNVFPVIPLGAKAGASNTQLDNGGAKVFVGLSFTAWIAMAIVVTIATTVLTTVGVVISYRRRRSLLLRSEWV